MKGRGNSLIDVCQEVSFFMASYDSVTLNGNNHCAREKSELCNFVSLS